MQRVGSNIANRLYAAFLRANYRPGGIVYDPDYASKSDPELWDKCRRDPIVLSNLEYRAAKIAGPESLCQPAGESDGDALFADLCQGALDEIEDWDEVRIRASEAFARGASWGWPEWETRLVDLGGLGEMPWRVPVRIKDVDKLRFEQRTSVEDGVCRWYMFSVARNSWEPMAPETLANFFRIVYRNTEDALGYGRGLMEAIYHFLYFRDKLLQKALGWADGQAFGQVVAKLNGLRRSLQSNAEIAADFERLLHKQRREHTLVVDKEDDVVIVQGGEAGARVILDLITYFDTAIAHLLIGGHLQMGSTGASDSGSLAQAEVHAQTGDDLIRRDQRKLVEAVRRDLLGQFRRLNHPQLVALGLGRLRTPIFSVAPEETEDVHASVQDAIALIGAGVPLLKEDVYRRTGWQPVTQADIDAGLVIGGESPAAQPVATIPGFFQADPPTRYARLRREHARQPVRGRSVPCRRLN